MTTQQWFEKFERLSEGDMVQFGGLELIVCEIFSDGGGAFSRGVMEGGEIIPVESELWDTALIKDKSLNWVDTKSDGDSDQADWWKG